jgi:hypothetical protein
MPLTIVNSMKELRFELRQRETRSILYSINLTQLYYVNDRSDELISNIAMMRGDDPCLIAR